MAGDGQAMGLVRAAGILLVLGLLTAPALAGAIENPTSRLEQLMMALRPTEMRPPSHIDPVVDTLRTYDESEGLDVSAEWSERTTLNAIALSRRSGAALGAGEVADVTRERETRAASVQVVVPHADIIIQILTLGVTVDATIRDIPFADSFTQGESVATLRDITDANTLSGLALITNGIPIDPRVLVDSATISSRETTFQEAAFTSVLPPGVVIPQRDVIAAAAVSDFGDSKIPRPFASSTQALSHVDHVEAARVVAIPESTALLAIALARQGISVSSNDLMNITARSAGSVHEATRHGFVKADVLFALLLGLEVEAKQR